MSSYVDLELSRSPTIAAPENSDVTNLPVLRVVFATPPANGPSGIGPASLQITPASSPPPSSRVDSPSIAPDLSERGRPGVRRGTSVSSLSTVATGNTTSVLAKPPNTRDHVVHHVSTINTNWILVILFFASGLIDSVAFNSWSCFVSMQTGNTIFAALGLSRQPISSHPAQYVKSMLSIGAFCLGSYCFATLHRRPFLSFVSRPGDPPPSLRRSVLVVSFFVQAIFIAIAATLVTLNLVSNLPFRSGVFSSGNLRATDGNYDRATSDKINWIDLAPIALLAFQAAGQAALSRALGMNELPTIVLSTIYYDFMAEVTQVLPHERGDSRWERLGREILWNEKRNRRFGSIAALFLGGLAGGFIFRSDAGMDAALWLACGLKFGVCFAWIIWPNEESNDDDNPV